MAILAKEKGSDFIWFFLSLKKFCFYTFGLDLEKFVQYILTDACDAEYNAVTLFIFWVKYFTQNSVIKFVHSRVRILSHMIMTLN